MRSPAKRVTKPWKSKLIGLLESAVKTLRKSAGRGSTQTVDSKESKNQLGYVSAQEAGAPVQMTGRSSAEDAERRATLVRAVQLTEIAYYVEGRRVCTIGILQATAGAWQSP